MHNKNACSGTKMRRKNSVGLSFPTEQALINHMNGIPNIKKKNHR